MSHLQYTAKSHHLQWNIKQLLKICSKLYHGYCPQSLKYRHNVSLSKVSDKSLLVLLLLQVLRHNAISIVSVNYFLVVDCWKEVALTDVLRQLIWLVQLVRQAMNKQISPDTIVIMDSFPLELCQSVRNHKVSIFNELADIGYNASKHLWFYGFKVHMVVALSGYILNDVVPPALVHDIKVVDDLLEGCQQSVILADLGYLSYELKEKLAQKGYHLWTPLRQNMAGANQHNNWKRLAMRRTIETRFSELCTLFDIGQTVARGRTGLQLRLEQFILTYNLSFFEFN